MCYLLTVLTFNIFLNQFFTFEITDPPPPPQLLDGSLEGIEMENLRNSYREDLKRFRKEYCQPVQFR